MSDLAVLPAELVALGLSVVLLLVHVMLQGQLVTRERGLTWNAGARDGEAPAPGRHAGRAARALDNFKETYPAFIAVTLAVAMVGRGGTWSEAGVWVWLIARAVYLPLYLFGIPYLRTVVWIASLAGLLMILVQLFTAPATLAG